MKNFSFVLNVILIVAVSYLYYQDFSGKPILPNFSEKEIKASKIVFVNSDSLLDQYKFFKDKKIYFDQKQSEAEDDLKMRAGNLQKLVEDYQKKAESMSAVQRQQTEEKLTQQQQSLMKLKNEKMDALDEEQSKFNDSLRVIISGFMKAFNKDRHYDFVLGYQRGSGILFASDSLDITEQVIDGLNKKYDEENHK